MLARIAFLRVEFLVAVLLVVFALVEMVGSLELHMGEEFTLGPGAMPLIYSTGLLIFAGLLLWTSRPKRTAIAVKAKTPDEEKEEAPALDYVAGIKTFLLVVLFVAAIYYVGFLIGTALFAFLQLKLVMRVTLAKSLLFGLLWGGGLYFAFEHLLEVQLEPGLLFSGS
jgi:Tripartite tricarboxylate transporter TctB family